MRNVGQLALSLALGGGVLLASAPLANAQLLGPANASAVVDVAVDTDSASCVNVGMKFDTRLLPDGTEAPFDIPAGQMLVVTAIELLGFGAGPGANVQTRIFRGVGTTVNHVAKRESIADGTGRIFQIYEFNPGLVVQSGGEVCTNNNLNIITVGFLRGYLAPP